MNQHQNLAQPKLSQTMFNVNPKVNLSPNNPNPQNFICQLSNFDIGPTIKKQKTKYKK